MPISRDRIVILSEGELFSNIFFFLSTEHYLHFAEVQFIAISWSRTVKLTANPEFVNSSHPKASLMCNVCTASAPSSEEPSRLPHPRMSSLSLCDTAALCVWRCGCWLSLSPLPSLQGAAWRPCFPSVTLRCSSFLVEINICPLKALRVCPVNPCDLECASSNLSVSEAQQPGFALCCHRRGWTLALLLPLVTVGCFGGKPPLKAPCWHLTGRRCPLLCVKRKPRVTTTQKLNFSSHTSVTLNRLSFMIKGQCHQFYTLKCIYWSWGSYCMWKKSSIMPFGGPEEATSNLINCLQWCHSLTALHCE